MGVRTYQVDCRLINWRRYRVYSNLLSQRVWGSFGTYLKWNRIAGKQNSTYWFPVYKRKVYDIIHQRIQISLNLSYWREHIIHEALVWGTDTSHVATHILTLAECITVLQTLSHVLNTLASGALVWICQRTSYIF